MVIPNTIDASTPIRLSALTTAIRTVVERNFSHQSYWVLADVASHKFHAPKGFHYFDLVEKGDRNLLAKVNAVAWSEGAARIRDFERQTGQRFGDDIHVLACVRVDFHALYGLKLTLIDVDAHFTLGQLEAQRQAVFERLLQEAPKDVWKVGDRYMTSNKTLRLPRVIQRIAVVASERSAGYEDFRHSLTSHSLGYSFRLTPFDTLVQGPSNAIAIVRRLVEISTRQDEFDAVVIVRGGGAQTDLLIFDQYEVARAVAGLRIPVLTGIGHLRNETITDMMAHTATKTPTECADTIINHNRSFEDQLLQLRQSIILRVQQRLAAAERAHRSLEQRMGQSVRSRLRTETQLTSSLTQRLIRLARQRMDAGRMSLSRLSSGLIHTPESLLTRRSDGLGQRTAQLRTSIRYQIEKQDRELQHLTSLVRMASPAEILKRGFAILRKDGRILSDASAIKPGDRLDLILKDSELNTHVLHKTEKDGNEFDL